MTESVEVKSSDVVKLILQYLRENNLAKSLRALEEETNITMNTVESKEDFFSKITEGKWEEVLRSTSKLSFPEAKLMDLYEHLVRELIEAREIDVARSILLSVPVMTVMKKTQVARFLKLKHLLSSTYLNHSHIYGTSDKHTERKRLALSLSDEVTVVESGRLLSLLQDALKWRQFQGMLPNSQKYDLFRGKIPMKKRDPEAVMRRKCGHIKSIPDSHAKVVGFSPNGQHLITGTTDGFLEVWDYETCKLKKELHYQMEEKFMMHRDSILCINFSRDADLLASGSQDGTIKIWKIITGKCLRRIPKAHVNGVTGIAFNYDASQIASCSFNEVAKIHGLRSGKCLKEFRGHETFISTILFVKSGKILITGSADGNVKVWDVATSTCQNTFALPTNGSLDELPVHKIIPLPVDSEQCIICNHSNKIYITNLQGLVVKHFSAGKNCLPFIDCCLSSEGKYIYGISENGMLHCFLYENAELVHSMKIHGSGILGITHHPRLNLLASFSDCGLLNLWKN